MIPGQFEYVRPAGLHDALRILSEREGEAKVLSGGYSLLPLLKLRLAQPGLLVDIRDVDGLDGIVETDDDLRIGGRATHRQILEDLTAGRATRSSRRGRRASAIRRFATGARSAALRPRRPLVRLAGVLLAMRASVVSGARPASGRRRDRLLHRSFQTAIEPTELLDRGPHPALAPGQRGGVRQARAPGRGFLDCRLRGDRPDRG